MDKLTEDTRLIEKMFSVIASMADDNRFIKSASFHKTADITQMITDMGAGVVSNIKKQFDFSSPGGVVSTLFNVLTPGVLFSISPAVGILYTVARAFGLDLGASLKSIVDKIATPLKTTGKVSVTEVDAAVKAESDKATAALPDKQPEQQKAASEDLLSELRAIEKKGFSRTILENQHKLANRIMKIADAHGDSEIVRLGAAGLAGILSAMVPKAAGASIIAILGWLLKTILKSLGLLAGVGAVSGLLGMNSKTVNDNSGTSYSGGASSGITPPSSGASRNSGAKASGGYGREDPDDVWVINFPRPASTEKQAQTFIANELNNWAKRINPSKTLQMINNSSVMEELLNAWTAGADYVVIPKKYMKQIDVVNAI